MDKSVFTLRTVLLPLGFLALLGFTVPVMAQNSCAIPVVTTSDEAVDEFDGLLRNQCLGGDACQTGECKLVENLEEADSRPEHEASERVSIVLQELRAKALDLNETQLGVAQLRGMLDRWDIPALGDSDESLFAQVTTSTTREWQGSRFELFQHTPFELNLEDSLNECQTADQCQADLKSAADVYSLSVLIHRTLTTATQDKIADVGKMLKQFDQRWTTFHTESRAVFPWELIVNNLMYESAEAGFSGPPNYQWLVLHPSVGLAYDDSQEDELQEAILVDIVGRYQWRWGGKDDAEITRPWGVALAVSWSGEDPGYGLSVHLPRNWSIGVTRDRNENTLLIVSVEFAQYITDKRKNVDDIRERLQDLRF
jgi:hypothetical protein